MKLMPRSLCKYYSDGIAVRFHDRLHHTKQTVLIARGFGKTGACGMEESSDQMTRVLNAASDGDMQAAEDLIPLVYGELRKLAAWRLAQEAEAYTLQATALVHEAYLKLSPGEQQWQGRKHFFCAAAEAMRRILIDRARHRKAIRHGGALQRTEFADDIIDVPSAKDDEILAIHEILDRFAEIEPRKAEVVKLRYFVGMTIEEAAEALGISTPTAKRDWIFARAWLYRELKRDT
jgi:RNA polymerase sigma factor (TIGR02999 family)